MLPDFRRSSLVDKQGKVLRPFLWLLGGLGLALSLFVAFLFWNKSSQNQILVDQNISELLALPAGISESSGMGLTTDLGIFLGNLKGELLRLKVRLSKLDSAAPNRPPLLLSYVQSLYQWGLFHGDLTLIASAVNLVDLLVEDMDAAQSKENAKPLSRILMFRAKMNMSLHRFSMAQLDVKRSRQLGASQKDVARLQGQLLWNLGQYPKAEKIIRERALKQPGLYSMIQLARLEHELGHHSKAHQSYLQARRFFTGSNPIEASWILTQHGIHKLETNDLKAALELFRLALLRAPDYVLPLEHLAETLGRMNKPWSAIKVYKRVVQLTGNPEFKAALAAKYQEAGRTKMAKHWKGLALKGYQSQLELFPKAMYWHAANFYLGTGAQPQLGLQLLKKNQELRPSSNSWLKLASAQHQLGLIAASKASFQRALQQPVLMPKVCEAGKLIFGTGSEVFQSLKSKYKCSI